MSPESEQLRNTIDTLVDEHRDQCLWFLRSDFCPTTFERQLRVLRYIERYGDKGAYLKAADARRWLLQSSNERSAVS